MFVKTRDQISIEKERCVCIPWDIASHMFGQAYKIHRLFRSPPISILVALGLANQLTDHPVFLNTRLILQQKNKQTKRNINTVIIDNTDKEQNVVNQVY